MRAQRDPVDRGAGHPEVHGVRVEQDARRVVLVVAAEDHRQQGGDAHEQGDPGDQLGRGVGVGDLPEQVAVEDQAEGRGQQDHRQEEGQPDRHVLVLHQQGEDEGRDVGLGAEGEVEDPGGLIGEDQPHGHHGVGAAEGNAGDGEAQEVAHSGAGSYRDPADGPGHVPGVPAGAGTGVVSVGARTHADEDLVALPEDRDELLALDLHEGAAGRIGGLGVGILPVGHRGQAAGGEVGDLVGDVDEVGLGQVVAGRLTAWASRAADCQPWRATPLLVKAGSYLFISLR